MILHIYQRFKILCTCPKAFKKYWCLKCWCLKFLRNKIWWFIIPSWVSYSWHDAGLHDRRGPTRLLHLMDLISPSYTFSYSLISPKEKTNHKRKEIFSDHCIVIIFLSFSSIQHFWQSFNIDILDIWWNLLP